MTQSRERTERVMDLFESYYKRVFLFARHSLPPAQAEDVAQEVFIRLLQHSNLEKKTIAASYLLKIADNLIKRRYSRSRRFARYIEQCSYQQRDLQDGPTRDSRNASRSESPAWDDSAIESAFSRLSSEEQDAVNLIVCQGMSYEDAAYSLGVPTSTINNWKFRGLRKLRASLHAEVDLPEEPPQSTRPPQRGRAEHAAHPRQTPDEHLHRHGRHDPDDRPQSPADDRNHAPPLRTHQPLTEPKVAHITNNHTNTNHFQNR